MGKLAEKITEAGKTELDVRFYCVDKSERVYHLRIKMQSQR